MIRHVPYDTSKIKFNRNIGKLFSSSKTFRISIKSHLITDIIEIKYEQVPKFIADFACPLPTLYTLFVNPQIWQPVLLFSCISRSIQFNTLYYVMWLSSGDLIRYRTLSSN